jgi:hypothetical protein
MSNALSTDDIVGLLKKARLSKIGDPRMDLFKDGATFRESASATSGLTFYDLEAGAKFLYPVLTPLRNTTPRVSGKGGIQANWRAVTSVNSTNMEIGVTDGNRGGVQSITTKDYTAAYKGIGLEGNVTFEAQYAGQGFDDIKAVNTRTLLESVMIGEEKLILGGNSGSAFTQGLAGTLPNLSDSSTGGVLLNSTAYYVTCVPLSFGGYQSASVAGGVFGALTRPNADGSTDTYGGGAGKVSAEATTTTSGTGSNTHSITASLTTAVLGAAAYAWYIGTATGVERLAAITTAPTVVLTALPASTNQLSSSLGTNDNSANSTIFDGLIYQALAPNSGAYVQGIGAALTADNAGGIVEIDNALKDRWDNYRLTPKRMWVNSQQALNISQKVLAGGSSGAQRIVFNEQRGAIGGGVMISSYLNRFSMAGGYEVEIKIHPNMPAGMILMDSDTIPYPMSNVSNVMQIRTRQDYWQIEWPLVSRKWQHGIYSDEVLQHYFPPTMAVLYDVRNG